MGEHDFVHWYLEKFESHSRPDGLQGMLCLQDVVISPLQGTDVSLPFFYPVSVEFRNKSSHFLDMFNATRAAGDR